MNVSGIQDEILAPHIVIAFTKIKQFAHASKGKEIIEFIILKLHQIKNTALAEGNTQTSVAVDILQCRNHLLLLIPQFYIPQ